MRAQEDEDDAAAAAAGDDASELDEFDEYEEEEEEDQFVQPVLIHPDVSTTVYFPEKNVKIGERNSIVIGFSNKGRDSFNVTAMGAHLHSPFDYSYHIQNFTAYRIEGSSIGPGQQGSVEYFFTPDPAIEPHDFWLSAWVLYNNSAQRMFVNTVYNGTVTLVDEKGALDAKGIMSNVWLLAILAAIGYGIKQRFAAKPKRAVAAAEPAPEEDVSIYKPAARARRRK